VKTKGGHRFKLFFKVLKNDFYFQAASCALDASAKIYGYRVDSLHTDTLKLAGGVGKTAQEAGINSGAGDADQVLC